jgi:uncharacterized protein
LIIVDTSGVWAGVDPRQAHHAAASRILLRQDRRILSPFVLAELDYLVSEHDGQAAELELLEEVQRGAYELQSFTPLDLAAAMAVIRRYADLRLGLADASLVVLAERYNCHDILTLDQRHFRVVLGPNGRPFRLLPFDEG